MVKKNKNGQSAPELRNNDAHRKNLNRPGSTPNTATYDITKLNKKSDN